MVKKAWVVSVEMGFGHMRAARPLRNIAEGGKIIAADNYGGIPEHDRRIWVNSRKFYNFVSRLVDKGFLGRLAFDVFDRFQRIEDIGKIQTAPTFQLKRGYALIRKGWGKHLIEKLNEKPLPLVTTFFTIGHMAEHWDYKGEIYILTTDSDISRVWAPLNPKKSRIHYLASTGRAAEHLKNYGVSPKRIYLTGFPIPGELAVKAPLFKPRKPLAVTFAVGGAGAQVKLGREIMKGLASLIKEKKVVLHVILGIHRNLVSRFAGSMTRHTGIHIVCSQTKEEYFNSFNEIIAETDVLWTKPSELSFYAALGLPIVIAPPLGAQEEKNREWLLALGAGIDQRNPAEAGKWLPELLESGALARAAESGFLKIEKGAADNISKIVLK
jgi:hypothetical protein